MKCRTQLIRPMENPPHRLPPCGLEGTLAVYNHPFEARRDSTNKRHTAYFALYLRGSRLPGGAGDFDFVERASAWDIRGFTLRGAVGRGQLAFFWNVAADGVHRQGHVHAAVFTEATLSLLAQPHVWNRDFCFAYPAVTTNKASDLGMTVAAGGRAGGGGSAAQGFVSIADDLSFFDLFLVVAEGTHNSDDGRYGDYLAIRPHEPCELWFSGTSYALLDGTEVTNVNARCVNSVVNALSAVIEVTLTTSRCLRDRWATPHSGRKTFYQVGLLLNHTEGSHFRC